jgi:hypothetical protein
MRPVLGVDWWEFPGGRAEMAGGMSRIEPNGEESLGRCSNMPIVNSGIDRKVTKGSTNN